MMENKIINFIFIIRLLQNNNYRESDAYKNKTSVRVCIIK